MEDILKAASCSIPDLNASWMSRDKSVEDGIIKDAKASIFISQVMVNWLIVIIVDKASTCDNNSLRWLCNSKGIDLIQATVKCLCGRVGSHVPHSDHTRDVSTDNLLSAPDPLNADQTMIMAFQ